MTTSRRGVFKMGGGITSLGGGVTKRHRLVLEAMACDRTMWLLVALVVALW